MNFRDLTPEERAYYNKIKKPDTSGRVIKGLAIITAIFVLATLAALFA